MTQVLVTGANGFVGRVLCRLLEKAGYAVRGAVRRQDRLPSPKFLTKREGGNFQEVVIVGIGPETDWAKALDGVDVVVHLAARVHVMQDAAADPLAEFRKVNTYGTERLARMAAAASVKRLIYISSIGVNGKCTKDLSFAETSLPNPHDPYSVSKWEAEQTLHKISQETGLEVVAIRPPLVYGPGNPGNFLRLLRLVGRGVPLPLGLVNNRRSLVYVGNLADAIVTCLKHPAAAGQTYLVSDGEDVSTPRLIQRIAGALGRPARLFPVPPALLHFAGQLTGKSAEVERLLDSLVIDSSKIRRELGWTPPYTLRQGLAATVAGRTQV